MSDVSDQKTPTHSGEHIDRAYFLKDERAAENIEILREHLSSFHSAKIPGTNPPKFGPRLPRYGVHSMLALKTRFFAYDHPAILKECKTAFTNGSQIWFAAPFLNAMVDEFKKDNSKTASAFLIGLHEISHILDSHFSRGERIFEKYKALYPDAPEKSIHSMINIGMDIIINQKLVAAFEELPPGEIFIETVWGLAEPHQKYKGWSEEAVIQDLFKVAEEQDKKRIQQQKQQQPQEQDNEASPNQDGGDTQSDKDGNPEDGKPDQRGSPDQDGKPGKDGQPDKNGKPDSNTPSDENGSGEPGQDERGGEQPGEGGESESNDAGQGGQPQSGNPANGGQPDKSGHPGGGYGGNEPAESQGLNGDADPLKGQPGSGGPQSSPGGESAGDDFGNLPSLQKGLDGGDFMDMMTPEEFVKTALENGLEESLRKLGMLPDDMTVDEMLNDDGKGGVDLAPEVLEHLKGLEKDRASTVDNTINEAYADMKRNGGKYPGAHLLEAAAFKVRDRQKPKITWMMEAENNINGGLGEVLTSYDNLNDISMFNPDDMNMMHAPVLEGTTPAEPDVVIAGIVDTSGSMTDEILSIKITEAAGLVRKYRARLVLFSADSTVRSEPIVITPENIDEIITDVGIDMFGRGGTDLEGSLRLLEKYDCVDLVNKQAMVPSARTNKYPDAILYFTDLFDGIPDHDKLPEELHKTIFICPQGSPVNLMDEYKKAGWSLYPVLDETVININKPRPKRVA